MGNVMNILRRLQNVNIPMDFQSLLVSVIISLLFSILITVMYRLFFETRQTGSGVGRSFLIVGPAVTTLFLAIQFSLPLSLGLLGALSFVRFRTPIKQPEEVGYILVLIASSIGCATFNFVLVGMLIAVIFIALIIQRIMPFIFGKARQKGLLLISIKEEKYREVSDKLDGYVKSHFPRSKLESLSINDGITTLFYRFVRKDDRKCGQAARELQDATKAEKINVFLEGISGV